MKMVRATDTCWVVASNVRGVNGRLDGTVVFERGGGQADIATDYATIEEAVTAYETAAATPDVGGYVGQELQARADTIARLEEQLDRESDYCRRLSRELDRLKSGVQDHVAAAVELRTRELEEERDRLKKIVGEMQKGGLSPADAEGGELSVARSGGGLLAIFGRKEVAK